MKKINNIGVFTFGDQAITVLNSKHSLVPTQAQEIKISHKDKTALALAINHNIACLLVGETGTGKSSIIKYIAYKRKQPYMRVNMNGYTTPDELIGRMAVKDGKTYFEDGVITYAMREGALLVLDEVNGTTQDCLFVLHGLLDEDKQITLPNGEVIKPHPDFRVFATCNPDYEGTKTMNKAFLDRFGIILSINILGHVQETKLLTDRTGIEPKQAENLVAIATIARKDYIEGKVSTFISTRSLLTIGKLMSNGLDMQEAYKACIINKTTDAIEKKALNDFALAILKYADKTGEELLDMPILTTKREQDYAKQLSEELRSLREQKYTLEGTIRTQENLIKGSTENEKRLAVALQNKEKTIIELQKKIQSFEQLEILMKEAVSKIDHTKINNPT